MANFNAYGNLTNVQITTTDELGLWDTSVAQFKNVTLDELRTYMGNNISHTGDVTGTTSLTIADNSVTLAKMANMTTSSIIGRVSGSTGDPEILTPTQVRTLLNVADGANAYSHPSDGVDLGAPLTGAAVISDVTVNAAGHVTGFSTRNLALADLGYTGATNANNYSHPNHTGHVTSTGDGATGAGNESETRKKKVVEDFEKEEEDSVPDIQVTYKEFIL